MTNWGYKGELDVNGKKTGLWETYYPGGKILSSRHTYLNGILDGYWETYHWSNKEDQRIARIGFHVNGKQTGPCIFYYQNGIIEYKGTILNNNYDGLWEEFHIDGQPHIKGQYDMGVRVGVWKEFFRTPALEINELKFYV